MTQDNDVATQEAEVVVQDEEVMTQDNEVVTQEAEVVTKDNEVATQEAKVLVQDEEVACGGVKCSIPECMELNVECAIDETTKKVFRKYNIQNHDDKESVESASGTDSDSTNTANEKMLKHCKRIGRFGPPHFRKGGPTPVLRKNVVFDVSIPEPIHSVSHKVCLLQY